MFKINQTENNKEYLKNGLKFLSLFSIVFISIISFSSKAFGQAADLDQGENGSKTSPKTIFWQNGNLGPSGAHFAEGYSIAYRMRISSLVGTAVNVVGLANATEHKLVIEWDTKDQNGHALDYITHYNNMDNPVGSHQFNFGHAKEAVNPTSGTAFSGAPSLFPILRPSSAGAEVADMPGASFDALPTAARTNNPDATKMAIWGGTITGMSYVYENNQDATTASTKTQLEIRFKSNNGSTALIAWGGHIAAEYDWGVGRGASKVSGSPYHMRLISIDGKGGNQDRSLKAAAVFVPPVGCTISAAQTACEGSSAGLTYSVTGSPTGITNYSWTLTPGTTNAVISGGNTTTTKSGATVTSISIVPATGTTFALGTFSVSLVLTNLGGAGQPCTQTGTINPAVVTNAGADQTVCASSPNVTLAGSVSGGATTATWSGGGGTFNPNNTTLNAVYTPSAAEITAGTVTLTLTSAEPAGPCDATSNDMVITITANPVRPTVTYQGPECNQTNFSVTVESAVTGGSYTLTQDAGGVSPITKTTAADANTDGDIVFSNLTVGKGFSIILTVSNCSSNPTDCDNYKTPVTSAVSQGNIQTIETVHAKIEPRQSKVVAVPNPFSTKIRFNLESAVSGQGSLELYNMLGQKVKTVFQGRVEAGKIQTIEYTVPGSQRSNLIYVFRVGEQNVTGKLIGLRQ